MDKFKRQYKESKSQRAFEQIQSLQAYKKNWSKSSLIGSGCFVNITALGGQVGFEAYVDGESFDMFIRPAIQQAMEHSLAKKKEYLESQARSIAIELGQAPVIEKKTKYTCPECGGDKFDVARTVDLNTMQFVRDITDCEDVYCFGCDKDQRLESLIVKEV